MLAGLALQPILELVPSKVILVDVRLTWQLSTVLL